MTRVCVQDFAECKSVLIERGKHYLARSALARPRIAELGSPFLRHCRTLLTHSHSRVVFELLHAAATNERLRFSFRVFVTESQPDASGRLMLKRLEEVGIPCIQILDASVGYFIFVVEFNILHILIFRAIHVHISNCSTRIIVM